MAKKTAEEVIQIYFDDIWNACKVELLPEYCADPLVRHYADNTLSMSVAEQQQRIRDRHAKNKPYFTAPIRSSDGTYVTTIWNNVYASGEKACGIEVFKVVDGKITEVWNPTIVQTGNWA